MHCPPRNKWQINGQLKNNLLLLGVCLHSFLFCLCRLVSHNSFVSAFFHFLKWFYSMGGYKYIADSIAMFTQDACFGVRVLLLLLYISIIIFILLSRMLDLCSLSSAVLQWQQQQEHRLLLLLSSNAQCQCYCTIIARMVNKWSRSRSSLCMRFKLARRRRLRACAHVMCSCISSVPCTCSQFDAK